MDNRLDTQIGRVVRTEVGTLAGTTDAVIVRIESVPLADDPPIAKARVDVFILNRAQAAGLQDQLAEALGRFGATWTHIAH